MRRVWTVVLGFVFAACARPSVSDLVLARVNGEPITVEQLNESFTSSHQGHGVLLAGRGAVREFLDTVIDRRLLIQEALRIGAEENPEIQRMRATLRARRAAEGFYADQVTKKARVTDAEITAVHQRLGDRFSARHILVESRQDAARALERVRAGEEFGEVARQVSRADTASRGGDLGIVQWGRSDQRLEDVLWDLKKGEVSEPFETEDGWNLLYVVARASVEPPKLEEVRQRLKANLEQREGRARSAALMRKLMQRPGGWIDEGPLVEALTARSGEGPPGRTVVAEAAGEPITLERALKLVKPGAAGRLPPDRLRRQVRWLLEAEVFRTLLEKEGLARGYGDRPEVVRELDKVTDQAVFEVLVGKVVLAKVEIADGDVAAYYRDRPKEFTEPDAVKLSAILVEKEGEAEEIVSALADGKEFRVLARTASKDPTLAASGGEIQGWVTRGKLDPAVEDVAFSLKEGAVGIAKGKAGHYVVRLDKRRPEQLKPLDEVKERAREAALRQRSRDAVKVWVRKLREASTIEVDDAAIDRAIASYEASAREKAAGKAERK
jgi:peptidyl-prolyl cis-trans isomerase C